MKNLFVLVSFPALGSGEKACHRVYRVTDVWSHLLCPADRDVESSVENLDVILSVAGTGPSAGLFELPFYTDEKSLKGVAGKRFHFLISIESCLAQPRFDLPFQFPCSQCGASSTGFRCFMNNV